MATSMASFDPDVSPSGVPQAVRALALSKIAASGVNRAFIYVSNKGRIGLET